MVVIPIVLGLAFVIWRTRAAKMRSSTLAANQAAQQVQSPYAALHPRRPPSGIRGQVADRFLNRGGGF